MADELTRRSVGPVLAGWMAHAAPDRAPERLFEEAFARTMALPQKRAYPWHRWALEGLGPNRSRRLAFAGLMAVLVIAIAASLVPQFAGNEVDGPTPSPSRSPSTEPSASASVLPLLLPGVTVKPTAAITLDAPIAFATDGTTIWAFTANSDLLRIDPATNTVAASVKLNLSSDNFQGIAGDATGLWITDRGANKLLRFDPKTLRPVTSIDTVALPMGVLVTPSTVWVASTRGGVVQRFDPKTNKLTANISVGPAGPDGPHLLARGLGSIWTSIPNIGSVVRIDETTNAVLATIPITGPVTGRNRPCGGLAVGSAAVWVTTCEDSWAAQIDPATNAQVGQIDFDWDATIAMVGDRPWIASMGPQLRRLDPISRTFDRAITPGAALARGGVVFIAAESLWVLDKDAKQLLRLPLAPFAG